MRLYHKFTIALLAGLVAVFWVLTPVLATNLNGVDLWPAQIIDDAAKVWKIQFNLPLNPATITDDHFYILSGESRLETSLSAAGMGGSTVDVVPLKKYEAGREYKLFISREVASNSGCQLKTSIAVPFTFIDKNAKIQHITCKHSLVLASLTVKTSADIHRVRVGSDEMHYVGNNTFNLGLLDLKQGDVLTIRAYNEDNKLLETKKYTPEINE